MWAALNWIAEEQNLYKTGKHLKRCKVGSMLVHMFSLLVDLYSQHLAVCTRSNSDEMFDEADP